MKVNECMCNDVHCISPKDTICNCAKLMARKHIGCVPVCNEEKEIIGLVTDRDILLRSVACDKNCSQIPVSEIMTTNICCCESDSDISIAEELMSKNQIRRLPIVDGSKIVGILTLGDLGKNKNTNKESFVNTFENICNCNEKNAE